MLILCDGIQMEYDCLCLSISVEIMNCETHCSSCMDLKFRMKALSFELAMILNCQMIVRATHLRSSKKHCQIGNMLQVFSILIGMVFSNKRSFREKFEDQELPLMT